MGILSMEAGTLDKRSLEASCEPISSLDDQAIHDMYALYARYYDATSPGLFDHDLKAKDFAVVIRRDDRAIVGFSTLAIMNVAIDSHPLRAIYSGDTIIEQ